MTSLHGLSSPEVATRIKKGLTNKTKQQSSRSYASIFIDNIVNTINAILFGFALALGFIGKFSDAWVSLLVVVFNIIIGITQEIESKKKLDAIAILKRPIVTVIRDGKEQVIRQEEVVQDDIIVVHAGDQIVVDGIVIQGLAEVDESLLTGESNSISKGIESEVHSGSFVLVGQIDMKATHVGNNSQASKLTQKARTYINKLTPLQKEINEFLQFVIVSIFGFLCILTVYFIFSRTPFADGLVAASVIAGIIPSTLFAMITVSYGLGAVHILKKGEGALVQDLNAVESLSYVDVLCVDKTGTLTTNNIEFKELIPLGHIDVTSIKQKLSTLASLISSPNKTMEAIKTIVPISTTSKLSREIPFSSKYKWSGVEISNESLVLGAPEIVLPTIPDRIQTIINQYTSQGDRVLLFATSKESFSDKKDPTLPQNLQPLALIILEDELRKDVAQTIANFTAKGVALKIISGDNPQTVQALSLKLQLTNTKAISGIELAKMNKTEQETTILDHDIFGRISPEQKEYIVETLRKHGKYVAMVGDGVNDILSLKKAQLGIAMESGSSSTRAVANMVLLRDSFSELPYAFEEGKRIRTSIQAVTNIFVSRIGYLLLIYASFFVLRLNFPFTIKQSSLISLLSAGVPSLGLTLLIKAKIYNPPTIIKSQFSALMYNIISVWAGTVAVALLLEKYLHYSHRELTTSLSLFVIICGITIALWILPPIWEDKRKQTSPLFFGCMLAVLALFVVFCYSPLNSFWGLTPIKTEHLITVFSLGLSWSLMYILVQFSTFSLGRKDAQH